MRGGSYLRPLSFQYAMFTYSPPTGGGKRMYWKMSIDLACPLVPSMGQHDPLDGFVTYSELQATAEDLGESSPFDLKPEIADMAKICRGIHLATDDPLGIGGLLFDASRIAQLIMKGRFRKPRPAGKHCVLRPAWNRVNCKKRFDGVSRRVPTCLPRTRVVYRAFGGRKPAKRD